MAEDEEVDIIGNYDDISKISSGQLLSCDYTVHPSWIYENAEGGNFWSDSVPKNEILESNVEVLQSEEVIISEPEPVPTMIDLEWNGEFTLHDELVFEDEIPATIEEVVCNHEDEIITDIAITTKVEQWEPGAFETHPPNKDIKFIGPTNSRSLLKVNIKSQFDNEVGSNGVSQSKTASSIKKPTQLKRLYFQSQSVNKNKSMESRENLYKNIKRKRKRDLLVKFSKKVQMPGRHFENSNLRNVIKKVKLSSFKATKGKTKKISDSFGENITINHEAEYHHPENNVLSETVKFNNDHDSSSDVEVVIEDNSSDGFGSSQVGVCLEEDSNTKKTISPNDGIAKVVNSIDRQSINDRKSVFFHIEDNEHLSAELSAQLSDCNIPTEELNINSSEISDLEKYIHGDFFQERGSKTAGQYLRIRNHIISTWEMSKPRYITKTAVRNGLLHPGDVNGISRIHRLLEQLGVINFGHHGKHFQFLRPLKDHLSIFVQNPRSRPNKLSSPSIISNNKRRPRSRSNFTESNFTFVHCNNEVKLEETAKFEKNVQVYPKHIRSELDLVKCLKFSKENTAPFQVAITLSTLLCLQLHSLSSNYEVMGFLGGNCNKSTGRNKIHLTRYKPCRTSEQSWTSCEMCPVSQVEQSSNLRSQGLDLLGWFHSHPSFPTNPSRTDVQTQKEMQLQFSFDIQRPLVGVILSCLNMAFKCMYIMPKDLQSDFSRHGLPYELDVEIIKDCTDFKEDFREVLLLIQNNCDSPNEVINKFKSLSQNILTQFGYKKEEFFKDIF